LASRIEQVRLSDQRRATIVDGFRSSRKAYQSTGQACGIARIPQPCAAISETKSLACHLLEEQPGAIELLFGNKNKTSTACNDNLSPKVPGLCWFSSHKQRPFTQSRKAADHGLHPKKNRQYLGTATMQFAASQP
jgi:hypothetical protein